MSRNIKLTDGSVYPVDRCGAADGQLRIRIIDSDMTMLDAVQAFCNPELTRIIEHYFDGTETDHVFFEGYTQLMSLAMDYAAGGIVVILHYKEEGREEPA